MPVLHNFVNPIADEPGFLGTKPSDWNDGHAVDIDNADVNPAAGIVESKLSLNFPTHAPVTLEVANGLSLSGQQLSMGLAGANSTGTLSAQDWNTFNGKQSSLSFPLLASLGGTSISNTGTFTNHSNTIVVGGGTLSLGGFTLTVPATGTAALLEIPNIFIRGQTIDGTADEVQLTIQGHSTQTNNVFLVENSSGVDKFALSGIGAITASVSETTLPSTVNSFSANQAGGTVSFTGTAYGVTHRSSTVQTVTSFSAAVTLNGQTAPALIQTLAAAFQTRFIFSGNNAATINNGALILLTQPNSSGSGAHALNNMDGLLIQDLGTKSGAGALTVGTVKAINILDQIGGSTNYAVYTNKGLNRLGDQLSIVGSVDRNQLIVTGFTTQTLPLAHMIDNTAVTNAIRNVLQLEARSTGTAAAGFGPGLPFYAETATNSTYQQQGLISTSWIDATNASRKAKMSLSVYDTAARLGIEIEASGTAPMLGFYGVAPVVRATNAVAAGAFVTNTSGILNDTATFGGYTIGQIVQALKNIGILT
jgi:hypothetical protein